MENHVVSQSELLNILANADVPTITVSFHGFVTMTKKDNIFYHKEGGKYVTNNFFTKRCTIEYDFGKGYQTRVNEALLAEGLEPTFVCDKGVNDWSEWEIPTKVLRKDSTLFLYVYIRPDGLKNASYFVNGRPASDKQTYVIKKFLPLISVNKQQTAKGLAPDKQVVPHLISFSNIDSIEIGDNIYEIKRSKRR